MPEISLQLLEKTGSTGTGNLRNRSSLLGNQLSLSQLATPCKSTHHVHRKNVSQL